MKYLDKADLVVGARYRCHARNFEVGTWNGHAFEYMRTKFGETYKDEELYWDDDVHFGTVKPLERIWEK